MASTENTFSFEQIEVDSGIDATLTFEEINKKLEEYLLEKSIDTVQQTVFLTSLKR